MSISSMIRNKKEQFRNLQKARGQEDNIKRANELKKLREQRIQLEGKAELERLKQSELRRIESAKVKAPSKLAAFGTGLAAVMNKQKSQSKKLNRFGGLNRGSTGIQLGGSGFNAGGNSKSSSAFSFGPTPKAAAPGKKHRKRIIIEGY